jgi:aminoglycoside phosphotransferase (APT) family kinase protein
VVQVSALRTGGGLWLLRAGGAGRASSAVLRTGDPGAVADRRRLATEVAALACAQVHGLAAPRLIAADLDGHEAGLITVLMTVVPGSSSIPCRATPQRMRALGAGIARLHGIELVPGTHLPVRHRPLADVDFTAIRRASATTALLEQAETALAQLPVPAGPTVLVHGDLWQGNTMWDRGSLAGLIDWDAAGAGQHGIDLGSARCDAAIMFGLPAAGHLLDGWQHHTGQPSSDLAYWDLSAALSTPADMAAWLRPIHGQGRTDLDAHTLNDRRDAFAQAALDRLERAPAR